MELSRAAERRGSGSFIGAAAFRATAGGASSARPASRRVRRCSAFTLAEVLAALTFMAIVIPVAIHGLHVASLAGEVAERKSAALRVAQRVLSESIITTNWNQSAPRGTVYEGDREFEWTMQNEHWTEGQMRVLTVEVGYSAQGRPYSVRLSTLVDGTAPFSQMSGSGFGSGSSGSGGTTQ